MHLASQVMGTVFNPPYAVTGAFEEQGLLVTHAGVPGHSHHSEPARQMVLMLDQNSPSESDAKDAHMPAGPSRDCLPYVRCCCRLAAPRSSSSKQDCAGWPCTGGDNQLQVGWLEQREGCDCTSVGKASPKWGSKVIPILRGEKQPL